MFPEEHTPCRRDMLGLVRNSYPHLEWGTGRIEVTELKITGMTCGHCKSAVENALHSVGGVSDVRVDLANGTAQVDGDADVAALVAAVEEEGYKATSAGTAQG
jgi:copper chaperone